MVAYSFKKRFSVPIRAGTKSQTIRTERKRHARPGEEIQLYTGMRTKYCRLIGRATCDFVGPICIHFNARTIDIAGRSLSEPGKLDWFALRDGFRDFDDMRAFWREQYPGVLSFAGVLIQWASVALPDSAEHFDRGGQMDLFASEVGAP